MKEKQLTQPRWSGRLPERDECRLKFYGISKSYLSDKGREGDSEEKKMIMSWLGGVIMAC